MTSRELLMMLPFVERLDSELEATPWCSFKRGVVNAIGDVTGDVIGDDEVVKGNMIGLPSERGDVKGDTLWREFGSCTESGPRDDGILGVLSSSFLSC